MQSKQCSKCSETKPLDQFYGQGRSRCIICERKQARYRMGRQENKLRIALRDSKKAARKYGAYDDLTYDDVAYNFAMAGGRCAYCGGLSGELQLEHICPLSRNGQNTLGNITSSCPTCNRDKRTHAILSYTDLNIEDTDLILALLDRMAFRMGTSRGAVIELLRTQQDEYFQEDLQRYFERWKKEAGSAS